MLQRRIEAVDTRTDLGIILEPITNDTATDYGRLLLPPDSDSAITAGLFDTDRCMLERPDLLHHYLDDQELWAIEVGGVAVGITGLWDLDGEYPGLSAFITKAPYLRRGIGTMAIASLAAGNVFESDFAKPMVKTHVRNDNMAAIGALQKLGFYIDDAANLDAALGWNGSRQWLLANPGSGSLSESTKIRQSQEKFAAYMSNFRVTAIPGE